MLVERRQSEIHGNGVFARVRIKAGDWMYVYGEVIPAMEHPIQDYCMEHDDGMYLPYAPFCWLNYSAEPNCEFIWDEEEEVYYVETLRTIKKDEELTIDYGYDPKEEKSCK